MFKFFVLVTIFVHLSCSTNQSRRPISTSEVVFNGGNYEDQQWDDKLKFKRVSWFQGATLTHEVMFAELEKNSKFAAWMGTDKTHLSKCSSFKIVMAYSHIDAKQGNSFVFGEIEKSGLKKVNLLDFSHNLRAHQNFLDWKLSRHKIVGFCRSSLNAQDVEISIPGFRKKSIKF